MTERNSLRALKRVSLTANGELHIASALGEYKGHAQGEFVLDEPAIDSMIANFNRIANDIVIDYEHDSVSDRNGPHPAAGWIKALEKRADESGIPELWAKVEWTDQAAEMIRTGAYKYCSPVIDYEAIDRVSAESIGVELFNCAITNNPFLDGQTPIALSRRAATRTQMAAKQLADKPKSEEEIETEKPVEDEEKKEASKASKVAAEDDPIVQKMTGMADMLADSLGMDREQAIDAVIQNLDAVVAACKGSAAAQAEMNREAIDAATSILKDRIDIVEAELVTARRELKRRDDADLDKKIDQLVADKFLMARDRAATRRVLSVDPSFEAVLRSGKRVVPELQGEEDPQSAEEREVASLPIAAQRTYRALRTGAGHPQSKQADHKTAMSRVKRWSKNNDQVPAKGAA